MLVRRCATLFALSLFWLSACGPARVFPPPVPTSQNVWSVEFVQTGGFVGVHLVTEISSSGQMTIEDTRTGRTVSKPLSEATIRELGQLLAITEPGENAQLPSMCADCFLYDLKISSPTGVIRVKADDSTLGQSGALPLIDYLREIRDQALQSAI